MLIGGILTVLIVTIAFVLILMLPREREITVHSPLVITAEYPFTFSLYKERLSEFVNHLLAEKGFGVNRHGVPITEVVASYFARSLKIIVPAFFISMIFGTFLGIVQYYFREKWIGKLQAFFTWLFSSLPDFFLFILFQQLLIFLFKVGLPKFTLYGHDEPHSFIIPLVAITIFPVAHMIKFTYASLESEGSRQYILTARAKGLDLARIYFHMLKNSWPGIVKQVQVIMLYILSSLPIIEHLSAYQGAGYQLLQSILLNDEIQSFAFMLPFLIVMFVAVGLSNLARFLTVAKGGFQ